MKTLMVLISLVVILCFAVATARPANQVKVMPGSVARGERILQEQACLSCHSLNGRGGSRAPDFARPSGRASTPSALATAMWNHAPRMWGEFEAMQRQVPPLRSADMADLLAYFYATLHFAPSGDFERGRGVFEQKGCVSCHSEVLDPRARRLVDRWTQLNSPISWAERMWNHASEMDAATSNRGIRWPELSGQDIVDLIVFLNSSATPAEPPTFDIGEPELGRAVFERSCESCHSFGPGAGSTVDLLTRSRPASMTDYIAAMWNHAPAMRRRGGSTPKLRSGEMRDLMGFLFAQRYFFEQGDSRRGRQVYQDKGCVGCHERSRRESGAPDLYQATEVYSPVTLSSAVWRHGPSMMKVMKQRAISWPEFRGREMTDLIAYLNSKLIVRIGATGF